MMNALVRGGRMALFAICLPLVALAQTQVPFGGVDHDPDAPVEITSDSLRVDQTDGSATFIGGVVILQGEMRLAADEVRVEYSDEDEASGRIERMIATGGVTLVSGNEAAESRDAVYTIATGEVLMTGDVILTQGRSALSSDRLVVNLLDGTGTLDGGVRTILQQSDQ